MSLALAETAVEAAPPDTPARSLLDMAIAAWTGAGAPESGTTREGAFWVAEAMVAFRVSIQEPSFNRITTS
jgi:hypothetical protein